MGVERRDDGKSPPSLFLKSPPCKMAQKPFCEWLKYLAHYTSHPAGILSSASFKISQAIQGLCCTPTHKAGEVPVV